MAKTKRRAVAHNSLGQFLSKFTHHFDIEEAFESEGASLPNELLNLA